MPRDLKLQRDFITFQLKVEQCLDAEVYQLCRGLPKSPLPMSVALILWPNTLNPMGDNAVLRIAQFARREQWARARCIYGPHPTPICTARGRRDAIEYMGRIYSSAIYLNIWEGFTVVQPRNLNIWEGKASSTQVHRIARNYWPVMCALLLWTAFCFAIFGRLQITPVREVKSSSLENN